MPFEMLVLYRTRDVYGEGVNSFTTRFQEIFGIIKLNDGKILEVKYNFCEDKDENSYALINKLMKEKLIRITTAPLHIAFQEGMCGRPDWEVTDSWAKQRKNPILIRKIPDIQQDLFRWPLPTVKSFEILYMTDSEKGPLTDKEKNAKYTTTKEAKDTIKVIESIIKDEFKKFTQEDKETDSLEEKNKKLETTIEKSDKLLCKSLKLIETKKNQNKDLKAKIKKLEAEIKEKDELLNAALKITKDARKQNKSLKQEIKNLKEENNQPKAVAK